MDFASKETLANMLLHNGQYEVSTIPIKKGLSFYRCTRIKDGTEVVAIFIPLEWHRDYKTVAIERLQAIPHDNLLKIVD